MSTRRTAALLGILLLIVLSLTVGCTSQDETGETEKPNTSAPTDTEGDSEPDATTQEDSMLHVSPVQVTGTETAVIETSKGTVVLEFYAEDAPNHVASFIELAESGFYNGIKFHRVIPGFVAQGGDPLTRDLTPEQVIAGAPGIGTGGPGWNQKAEFNSRTHDTGTLAMARSQSPDSAGSQFYICLAPQPQLDGQYTVFGRVIEGMDVVQSLAVGDVIDSVTIRR